MVYIFDDLQFGVHYEDYWRTLVPDMLRDHGYEVYVVCGSQRTGPPSLYQLDEMKYRITQYQELHQLVRSYSIRHGDVFVFANPLNPLIPVLRHYLDAMGKRCKIVTVWQDISTYLMSRHKYRMGQKYSDGLTALEHSAFRCSDYCIFMNEYSKDRFLRDFGYIRRGKKLREMYCRLPFEQLRQEKNNLDLTNKRNKIVIPDILTHYHKKIVEYLKVDMPNYQIVSAVGDKLSRDEYFKHLSEAKVMLSLSIYTYTPLRAYEALLFEAFPLFPHLGYWNKILPPEYIYDGRLVWKDQIVSFVREHTKLIDRIQDGIRNYNRYRPNFKEDLENFESEIISDKPLLNIIKESYESEHRTAATS